MIFNNQEKVSDDCIKGTVIGNYKKKDIVLNSGKYGQYITYGKNNYSLKDDGSKEEILEKALTIIKTNKVWKIDKKTYTLKKGKFGYYLEEGKNNKISITKLINIIKKRDGDKSDVDIIEKITKDDISKFIITLSL